MIKKRWIRIAAAELNESGCPHCKKILDAELINKGP